MKKNVIIKMITIILATCILINYIPTLSKASWITDAFTDAQGFVKEDTGDVDLQIDESKFENSIEKLSDTIYGTLLAIAIFIAVAIIMVLGIQFMTGSIEQKAKVKEMLTPYIVGCIIVFGSFGIWKLVIGVLSSIV